ncbi:hypothetical protein DPMN_144464 [Dreissena polymorpha]|uniref:Uncharacterized protein n=1 Tax=Dreissena polymorpha TaxID=45954 RepID=A0A9D4GEP0_DREPO|nr:hypothetical protein DPMN_144464 [Dreissena polymorpha]
MLLKTNHNHINIFHHGDWTINVTESVNMKKAPPPFHEDWTINVASRVKNAQPPDIIGTNVLTKFHDDRQQNVLTKFHEVWTINVASKLSTRQMLTPHNTHRTRTI